MVCGGDASAKHIINVVLRKRCQKLQWYKTMERRSCFNIFILAMMEQELAAAITVTAPMAADSAVA